MEDQGDKLSRKMKENPFMPIGIVGFLAALGIGAYKYKHRGNMSRSLFLVQLRVAAQGVVVGSLCLGIIFSLGKRILHSATDKKEA
ncbi:HIG1 domain family member 1A, mitochondrial-like [Macrosteles quadrilineatus]|uniref:HIG1 domain family member 1A, mitochondrial-like n=1 Tax=Macrosteles quadrilineatus TaxID=74068 RepID=UPI0023E18A6D|nr:HIG1 domain family member 1A, mitochondrial-like [Macrosteles quadrilineatus]